MTIPWFPSALAAADLKRRPALLHRATGSPGQVSDEQSKGAAHVRRALLHTAHSVSVLQEAAARLVPPGPPVQGWVDQAGTHQTKPITYNLIVRCPFQTASLTATNAVH